MLLLVNITNKVIFANIGVKPSHIGVLHSVSDICPTFPLQSFDFPVHTNINTLLTDVLFLYSIVQTARDAVMGKFIQLYNQRANLSK